MVVTKTAAAVYTRPVFDSATKLGYVKSGGRLPVKAEIAGKERCSSGWRAVVGGGYVCLNLGTTDEKDPTLRFTIKQPDLDGVLPYVYARNAKNGTPLYKSVPTPDQMRVYEPYLEGDSKERTEKKPASTADKASATASVSASATRARPVASAAPDGSAAPATPSVVISSPPSAPPQDDAENAEPATESPWWQHEKPALHEVTIDTLRAEADDVLAQRMVAGFYVALDKTFRWNNRLWYKTTKGLVAPADRFWQVSGSDFKGLRLDDGQHDLPVGWVYGSRKTAPAYELTEEGEKLAPKGSIPAYTAIPLQGEPRRIGGTLYWQTQDDRWIKDAHVRVATATTPPEDLRPEERWIAVNVTSQTLVAYLGTRPILATLVSTGKESTVKAKDHRSPRGQWRIREKHVTTTMDGDGTAAGDLPYSIEDVPYVAYYDRSYALHGAFWHKNYGNRMSHGCINLSPLDAKFVFFFTDPQIPPGWHGVFATADRPGSRVVVHE